MDRKPKYQPHPLAEHFPRMGGDELAALAEDISINGLREPIILYQGKILDGRNRYAACLTEACVRAGVKPKFRTVRFDSEAKAADWVTSQNLQRRHLNKSQQAMYVVRYRLPQQAPSSGAKRSYRTGESAIRRVGERYGVSHVSIYKAMYVAENNPALAAQVLEGKLSVAKAEKMIRGGDAPAGTRLPGEEKVPPRLHRFFRHSQALNNTCVQLMSRVDRHLTELPPAMANQAKKAHERLQHAIVEFESLRPAAVCGRCSGDGCAACGSKGWLSASEPNRGDTKR